MKRFRKCTLAIYNHISDIFSCTIIFRICKQSCKIMEENYKCGTHRKFSTKFLNCCKNLYSKFQNWTSTTGKLLWRLVRSDIRKWCNHTSCESNNLVCSLPTHPEEASTTNLIVFAYALCVSSTALYSYQMNIEEKNNTLCVSNGSVDLTYPHKSASLKGDEQMLSKHTAYISQWKPLVSRLW